MANGSAATSTTVPTTLPQQDLAPRYEVPPNPLANIEHPSIIRNVDKGIQSLGGHKYIEKLLTSTPGERNIAVAPKPEDPFAQYILSRPVKTQSIAFKVCLPKRTGRKRKRGSNDPYVEDPSGVTKQTLAAEDVLKRLQDNPDNYQIEAVGHVNETHRFRSMPDFANSNSDIPLIDRVKSQILPEDFDKMKDFTLAPTKGAPSTIWLPPPKAFNLHPQPYNYFYRQNPAIRITHDASTGEATIQNTQQPERLHLQPFPGNAPILPSTMPASLPPLESLSPDMQAGITKLRAYLATRPVITRRVGLNHLGAKKYAHSFKAISQWCGYQFKSGPWRDTLVRYGVDPRTDPRYREYQTVMFQLASSSTENNVIASRSGDRNSGLARLGEKVPEMGRAGERRGGGRGALAVSEGKWSWNRAPRYRPKEGETASHIFDGRRVWTDGKVWQVCDIQAPLLRELLEKSPLREECDLESDGWYANGSWSKFRVIMKDMISVLLNIMTQDLSDGQSLDHGPDEKDEAVWRDIAELLPDIQDEKSLDITYIAQKRKQSRLEELATQVRTFTKKGMGGKYREESLGRGMFDAKRNAAVLEAKELAADEGPESETPARSGAGGIGDVDDENESVGMVIGVDEEGEMEENDDDAEDSDSVDPLMDHENNED